MPQTISDSIQLSLAQAFLAELRQLHSRMAYSSYKSSTLTMRVVHSGDESTCEIELSTGDYPSTVVRGSALGPVMDEAYHRLNYQDRQQALIDSSLVALPAPDLPAQDLPAQDNNDIQF